MISLLRQECYKSMHKKSILFSPVIIFLLMLFVGLSDRSPADVNYYTVQAFNGYMWLFIALIIMGANSIVTEFEYGTMKRLISQHSSRFLIYAAKMVMIIRYSVIGHLLVFGLTFVVAFLIHGNQLSLTANYLHGMTVFQSVVVSNLSDLFSTLLVIAVVFMVASMSRTSSIAAVGGIVFIFSGQPISNLLMHMAGQALPVIKWNPGNMFNVGAQYLFPDIEKISHLTDNQLVIGNLIWTILFIAAGYYAFSRKRV